MCKHHMWIYRWILVKVAPTIAVTAALSAKISYLSWSASQRRKMKHIMIVNSFFSCNIVREQSNNRIKDRESHSLCLRRRLIIAFVAGHSITSMGGSDKKILQHIFLTTTTFTFKFQLFLYFAQSTKISIVVVCVLCQSTKVLIANCATYRVIKLFGWWAMTLSAETF